MEPTVKYVEDCEQASLWVRCAAFYFGFQPSTGPYSLSPFEKRNRESLFGIKIGVETGFSAT